MATKKKLYRNVYVVEILSEEPLPDGMSLEQLEYEMNDGDCSGVIDHKHVNQEVTGRKAAKMVIAQGSDPLFFQMNEFGNEVEE
jgi:hypothetical protein